MDQRTALIAALVAAQNDCDKWLSENDGPLPMDLWRARNAASRAIDAWNISGREISDARDHGRRYRGNDEVAKKFRRTMSES